MLTFNSACHSSPLLVGCVREGMYVGRMEDVGWEVSCGHWQGWRKAGHRGREQGEPLEAVMKRRAGELVVSSAQCVFGKFSLTSCAFSSF